MKGNYTLEDYVRWGKLGGRPRKFINRNEMLKFYRRQRILKEVAEGKIKGFLNTLTGRVNKQKRKSLAK